MLILSEAKITIRPGDGTPDVRVEGSARRHEARIRGFVRDQGVARGVVRRRGGQWRFSRHFDAETEQRMRNFLTNECPVKD